MHSNAISREFQTVEESMAWKMLFRGAYADGFLFFAAILLAMAKKRKVNRHDFSELRILFIVRMSGQLFPP